MSSSILIEAFKLTLPAAEECPLTTAQIAACYGRSRQAMEILAKRYRMTAGELAQPEILLSCMEHFGNESRFRTKLRNPKERAAISKRIAAAIEKQSQR